MCKAHFFKYVAFLYKAVEKGSCLLEWEKNRIEVTNIYKDIMLYLAELWQQTSNKKLELLEYEQYYQIFCSDTKEENREKYIDELLHYYRKLIVLENEETIEHTYYFDSKYRLQTGWVKVNNVWRYFEKADNPGECYEISYEKADGWITLSDGTDLRKSYVNSKNSLVKGWLKQNGNKYYFNSSGMLEYGWFTVGSSKYFADENGIVTEGGTDLIGWQIIDGQKYYFRVKCPVEEIGFRRHVR